jgi:phosphoserine phosphatase RsbU/P
LSNFADIKEQLSKYEKLERELNLQKLQMKSLLAITQSINGNVKTQDLFEMYQRFLSWDMGVKKMALFVCSHQGIWYCATQIGIPANLSQIDISDFLKKYNSTIGLTEKDHPLISKFDLVIPVLHKNIPIAYAFIGGGYAKNDELYGKVEFITTITNVISVAIENKRLFKQQLEQEKINHELRLAGEMQHTLIPKLPNNVGGLEIDAIYMPHFTVGGDYYDFIEFDEGEKIMFCVADISGKGIAAALLMANFQANLRSLVRKRDDPQGFIQALNKAMFRITQGDRYVTFFIAEYTKSTRMLRYVNAGHIPPILIQSDSIIYLDKGCTFLGNFESLKNIKVGEVKIDEDALILAFTDGLTDIKNEQGDFLDPNIIESWAFVDATLNAKELNVRLMDNIGRFKGEEDYPDDFTLLTCKFGKG